MCYKSTTAERALPGSYRGLDPCGKYEFAFAQKHIRQTQAIYLLDFPETFRFRNDDLRRLDVGAEGVAC
jgi:hypothetical protein